MDREACKDAFTYLKIVASSNRSKALGKVIGYNRYLLHDKENERIVVHHMKPVMLSEENSSKDVLACRTDYRRNGLKSVHCIVDLEVYPDKIIVHNSFDPLYPEKHVKEALGYSCTQPDTFLNSYLIRMGGRTVAVVKSSFFRERESKRDSFTIHDGQCSYNEPVDVKKANNELRNELNKLIRKKRQLLRARSRLGVDFTYTVADLASCAYKARSFYTEEQKKKEIRSNGVPYVNYYQLGEIRPFLAAPSYRISIAEGHELLAYLYDANASDLDSIKRLMNAKTVSFHYRVQQELVNSWTKSSDHWTEILKLDGTTKKRLEQYNALDNDLKLKEFEKRLRAYKPAIRLAYGADYYECVTQAKALEIVTE